MAHWNTHHARQLQRRISCKWQDHVSIIIIKNKRNRIFARKITLNAPFKLNAPLSDAPSRSF
jgi:hypothetical protein